MKRAHDHLFTAAGVTAALSMIGTGVTLLNGSVLHFDAWPSVASTSQARQLELPVAPLMPTAPKARADAQDGISPATRQILRNLGVTGTLDASRPGSLSFSIAGPTGVSVAAPSILQSGDGSLGTGGARATTRTADVTLSGSAGSLGGDQSSAALDGAAAPAADPAVVSDPVALPGDTDGDGVPDTWETDAGVPTAAPQATTGGADERRSTSVGSPGTELEFAL